MRLPPTPSQTIGPFFRFALPFERSEQLVAPKTPGALRIEGRVFDGLGAPVPDAMIEIWQADRAGRYPPSENARHDARPGEFLGFGRCCTDPEGVFHFTTVKPGPVPLPDGRRQAPHLEVSVFARGLLRRLVTRMYFPDEEAANLADPVLLAIRSPAVRSTLVARARGRILTFDIRLQGDRETAFFAL